MTPHTAFGPPHGGNYELSWQGPFLKSYLITDIGRKRRKNEDSFVICAPECNDLSEQRGILFAVADGMGGAVAGEHASQLALQVISDNYYNVHYEPAPKALLRALSAANEQIFREAESDPKYSGMGTTISAVVVQGEWAYIAQVGDSRVYLLRDKLGLNQITQDHSLVAEQVRSGLLSEEEARTHSLKNLITRAVGIKDSVSVDLYAVRLKREDTLLICSDGLSNSLTEKEITQAISNGDIKSGTRKLVEQALNRGGSDNITSICIRVTDAPPKTNLQAGAQEVRLGQQETIIGKIRSLFAS